MQKQYKIKVDITKKYAMPAFEVNTNDLKSIRLSIEVLNGASPLDLKDKTVRIAIRKPDNHIVFQDCTITDATNGQVEVILENQAYITPGTHTAEIMCYKGKDVVAVSGTFSYKSSKGIMNDEAVESKSEFTAINRTIEEAERILEDLRENGGGVGVDEQARQGIQEVTAQLADTAKRTDPIFSTTPGTEAATLGAELLDSSGWTTTGWTGDFNTGFKHVVGQTSPLRRTLPSTGTKMFQVELTLTSSVPAEPGGLFSISIGGSEPFDTYKGGGTTMVYNFGIKSLSNGDLVITPIAALDGTITKISVREITTPSSAAMVIKDAKATTSMELRFSKSDLNNIFFGNNAGQINSTGDANVVLGHGSLRNNTAGFWNSVLGVDALVNNTMGSRNIALGRVSLHDNITGHRNIAVGTFSLNRNTHGAHNIGVGADSLWYNTTGSRNIGIGTVAVGDNTTGNDNIGIGYASMEKSHDANSNIGIGSFVMHRNSSGSRNVGIGERVLERVTSNDNLAIGYYAANWISAATNALAIGNYAQQNSTGSSNVAIGHNSQQNTANAPDNVSIGNNALKNATGERNVAIGNNAATGVPNAGFKRNVVIGHNAGASMETGADYNVIIGSSSGVPLSTGASNILIGYAINTPTATTSNHLNIGNVIKGDLSTKKIGIGVDTITATLHLKGGNTAAGSAPMKLNPGTPMTTPEAGAIEYDGTKLYITTGDGVRRQIAFVS